jgi:hypothetical protein
MGLKPFNWRRFSSAFDCSIRFGSPVPRLDLSQRAQYIAATCCRPV